MKHESRADRACRELLLAFDLRALSDNELERKEVRASVFALELACMLERRSLAELEGAP